jgi:ubiquinone/menaquinone biosynthesis C-methylase UbiE
MTARTRKEILDIALELRASGELFDPQDKLSEDFFRGSIERFTIIAEKFEGHHRVLDVGAGNGLLLSLLKALGHECYATDYTSYEEMYPVQWARMDDFRISNVEVERLPYEDNYFDAVSCCQVLEHFTHSHLPAMLEMKRILKPGGVLEIDVPNVASYRNRSRLLRGRNITHDYKTRYLHAEPILHNGMSFYPDRHNREFTKKELDLLFSESGFTNYETHFLKSRRYRTGADKLKNVATAIKNSIPSIRKSLIGFAVKD